MMSPPVDQPAILLWLGHFLWPFLRITGLFLTAPVFGAAMVPNLVKAILAATLAAALALWLPGLPAFPGDPPSAILAGLIQITYGAALGLVMQLVVITVASAGEIAGLSMGLGFAELQFRESNGATPVLYDIMLWAGLLGYMAAGGPLWLFAALAHSFAHGVATAPFISYAGLAALGGNLIASAIALALPVIAAGLCVNLTVGLTTVFAPQMNLLTIGFPLLILAGLWVLSGSVLYVGPVLAHLMGQATNTLSSLVNV